MIDRKMFRNIGIRNIISFDEFNKFVTGRPGTGAANGAANGSGGKLNPICIANNRYIANTDIKYCSS